jgi:O-antigen ligase
MSQSVFALLRDEKAALHPALLPFIGIAIGTALFFIFLLPLRYAIVAIFTLLAPLLVFLLGQWKNFFLALAILGIPLQVKTTLFGYSANQIGGPGGIDLTLADCAMVALYIQWFYECLTHKDKRAIHFTSIELFILLSIFISAISLSGAVNLTLGFIDLLRVVKISFFYLYLANNIRRPQEFKLVIVMLFLGTLVHNLASVAQYMLGGRRLGLAILGEVQKFAYLDTVLTKQGRPGGIMQGANTSAVYLVCILPFAFTSLFWLKRKLGIISILGFIVSCLVVLIITLSRAAWLGFLLSFPVLFYMAVKRQFIQYNKHFLYGLLFILLSTIIFTVFSAKIYNRIFNAPPLSGYFRSSVNKMTMTMIYSHPFFGLGLNNYQQVAQEFIHDMPDPKNVSYLISEHIVVHNLYLLTLAELGPFGLMVFLYIIYLLQKRALFLFRSDERVISSIGIAYFCCIIGLMASEIFDFSYRLHQLFYLFWTLAGLTVAASRMEKGLTNQDKGRRKAEEAAAANYQLLKA